MSTSSVCSNGINASVHRHKSVEYTTALDALMELKRQYQKRGEPRPYNRRDDQKKLNIDGYRELAVDMDADLQMLKRPYEAALKSFGKKDVLFATRVLENIVEQHPDDGPTTVVLSRTVGLSASAPDDSDPVWELSSN